MLKEYFYYREVCDDEKMDRYFSRTIDIVRDKYKQMLRVESIEFDPLVSKYFEAEYITTKENAINGTLTRNVTLQRQLGEQDITVIDEHTHNVVEGSGSSSDEHTSENSERITDDGSNTKQGSGTSSGSSSTTGQNNISSNTTDGSTSRTNGTEVVDKDISAINKNATKAAPMNASGVGHSEGGKLTGLDFGYASAYGQNDADTKENDSTTNNSSTVNNGTSSTTNVGNNNSTTSNNGSTSNSETGTNSNVRVGSYGELYHNETGNLYDETGQKDVSGRTTFSRTGANTDTTVGRDVNAETENGNEVKRDRYAGRDDVLPQDAMASATHYLMNYSTAFQWLCNKLEPCFIGIYDI